MRFSTSIIQSLKGVTSSTCWVDITQKVGKFLASLSYMMHFSPPKLSMVAPLLQQECPFLDVFGSLDTHTVVREIAF